MKLHSYQESIDWMFQQFPSYQHIGAGAYKPGLEQTRDLLNALNIKGVAEKIIHVAGTNGKGSTCAYIGSILVEKNEKVGQFTSPHIYDFRERIRINGEQIEENAVLDFCQRVINLKLDFEPSFFELTFAMAMDYFERNACSILVIETGMGGRLDATNVLPATLSIITNIGLDHTQFLGETLSDIAREKAGIIKRGVPIVIGQTQPEIAPIFSKTSADLAAPIYFAQEEQFEIPDSIHLPKLQRSNLNTALCALDKVGISVKQEELEASIRHLRKNTGLFGRLTKIAEAPLVYLDVSHNKEGFQATFDALNKLTFECLHVIYGAAQDKNVTEIFSVFPDQARLHLVEFSNNRSMKMEQWFEFMKCDERIQSVSSDVNSVLESLKKTVSTEDLILVTGSFFLLSDLKQAE
jgi:dihydrofolate synthase/folylpolyglutamate synthase